jgi:hypothetical protein
MRTHQIKVWMGGKENKIFFVVPSFCELFAHANIKAGRRGQKSARSRKRTILTFQQTSQLTGQTSKVGSG